MLLEREIASAWPETPALLLRLSRNLPVGPLGMCLFGTSGARVTWISALYHHVISLTRKANVACLCNNGFRDGLLEPMRTSNEKLIITTAAVSWMPCARDWDEIVFHFTSLILAKF